MSIRISTLLSRLAPVTILCAATAGSALAGPVITIDSPNDNSIFLGPTDVEICVSASWEIDPATDSTYYATVVLVDETSDTLDAATFPIDFVNQVCRTVDVEEGSYAVHALIKAGSPAAATADSDRIDFTVLGLE